MKQILRFTIEEAKNELKAVFQKDSRFEVEIQISEITDLVKTSVSQDVVSKIDTNILSIVKNGLIIPKTDGKQIIYQAKKTFKSYIDQDFKNWELGVKQKPTKEIKVNVFEAIRSFKFTDIFTNPEKQAITQSQIIKFCEKHTTDLRQDGFATFFLTKVGDQYFVVNVRVDSDGLDVYVSRLEYDFVWDGEYRLRVVSPQL